jgi:hypothetical protein
MIQQNNSVSSAETNEEKSANVEASSICPNNAKPNVISRLFHSHNYIMVNQFEMKSEFDIVCQNGFMPNTWTKIKRKVITDYKCTICNKIKRFEETTPR